MKLPPLLLAAAALAGTACLDEPPSRTTSVETRQADGRCPGGGLRAGGAPGALCATSADCAEVCCACGRSSQAFASSACVDSACASVGEACVKGEDSKPSLCP